MARQNSARRSYSLTREQKLSVGVLGVCGLVAILLSFVQLRRALIHPFTTPVQSLVELKRVLGPTAEELDREAKKADTDGDGISDYDELNVYYTSPYLRDSDSDGDADNIEIAKGEDPNCPKGTVCVPIAESSAASGEARTNFPTPGAPDYGSYLPGSAVQPSSNAILPAVPERNVNEIRAFLEAQGVSRAELDGYSDEEVLAAYDEAIAIYGSGAGAAPVGSVTSTE
jgi:hypothetical protein